MPTRIRDASVAEELAAQAGTEETPDLFLSDFVSPIIFGPQRPPLSTSGYFAGCVGVDVPAVALNFGHTGIFLNGTAAASIIRVNRITIENNTGADAVFTIRRLDAIAGFTLVAAVPGYIDAGLPTSGGVFSCIRSNLTTLSGVQMARVRLASNAVEHFEGPWILNNGALLVAPTAVNTPVMAYFGYEHWTSIREQPTGS